MTMKMRTSALLVGLLCLKFSHDVAATSASSYTNYEGSAADVVQKLMDGDQYEKLFLKYHQCVWSEYEGGCESGGEYWYSGSTPCYRANVEYSLYGIPKGKEAPSNGGACKKAYYINTFFSTSGVSSFASSMGMDSYPSSECQRKDGNNANNNNNNNKRFLGYTNNANINAGSSSYTTFCAADGSFVQSLFEGSYCSQRDSATTLDELSTFNEAMGNMQCQQIYSASANNNNNNNALNVLTYSESCSRLEYPRTCRDPFGTKNSNDFKPTSKRSLWKRSSWMDKVSYFFLMMSAVFCLIPCLAPKRNSDRRRRFFFCFRRRNVEDATADKTTTTATKSSTSSSSTNGGFGKWFRTKILRRSS